MNVAKSLRRRTMLRLLTKPTRSRLFSAAARRFVRPATPVKWIFVVGCYNSGTTLLERLLGTHPLISTLDEGAFRTDQLMTPEEMGWPRMWCEVADRVRLTEEDSHADADVLRRDWALLFDPRRPIFLEKSVSNGARMRWLQHAFQNSYFVAVIRNGYAAAEGIRRKTKQGRWLLPSQHSEGYPIGMCARQWVVANEMIEQDSSHTRNFLSVTYEDLCANPRAVVEDIWRFAGIEATAEWAGDEEWRIQEKRSVIRNMNERSMAALSAQDLLDIEAVASQMLRKHGYLLPSRDVLSES